MVASSNVIRIIHFLAVIHAVKPEIILNSSLPLGNPSICGGETVKFYCFASQPLIAWSSPMFIGTGGAQLEYTASDQVGTVLNSTAYPGVYTNLTSIQTEPDVALTSQLIVPTNRTTPSGSVSCASVDGSIKKTTNFTILQDPPGVPLDPTVLITSAKDDCTLLIQWNHPENTERTNIDHYNIRNCLTGVLQRTQERSPTAIVKFFPRDNCSNYAFGITAVDRCGREGPSTTCVKPVGSIQGSVNAEPSGEGIAALSLVIITIIGILSFALFMLVYWRRRKATGNNADKHKADRDGHEFVCLRKNPVWCNEDSMAVSSDVAWIGRMELLVHFVNDIPRHWNSSLLNSSNIIKWANVWHEKANGHVPKFVEASPDEEAQIRVLFNNHGRCFSIIGSNASHIAKEEPTMYLDLQNFEKPDRVVIHHFGHVLGLCHEHQRSTLLQNIEQFIDHEAMKTDSSAFQEYTQRKLDTKPQTGSVGTSNIAEYDPKSIMLFPFRIFWLKEQYQDKSKLKRLQLTASEIHLLCSIHQYQDLANEPSKVDVKVLMLLYQDYDQIEVTPALLDKLSPQGQEEVRIYNEAAREWKRIGVNLGLAAKVKTIKENHPSNDHDKVKDVLDVWLSQADHLGNPTTYPKKWSGLISLLRISELNGLAERVHQALLQLAAETVPVTNH